MKKKTSVAKKIQTYLARYRAWIFCSLILSVITTLLNLYVPVLIGQAIDQMVSAGSVNFEKITALLFRIGVITAIYGCATFIMQAVNNKIVFRTTRALRRDMFEKLHKLPLAYLDAHANGATLSCMISDTEQFSDGLLLGLTQFFSGIVAIVGTFFFMLSLNVKITLLVVVLTPLSLVCASVISKKTYRLFSQQAQLRSEETSFCDETVSNMKTIQSLDDTQRRIRQFHTLNEKFTKSALRATFSSSLTNPVTRFINSLIYAAVGATGAVGALRGVLTIGDMSCFLSYATQYTKPFNEISGVVTELQNAIACADRIFTLLEQAEMTPDPQNAPVLNIPKGEIVFENVSFAYTPNRPLIKNFCLHVKPGQRIAIVGPTGCGKTTLINLLMRFYDPNNGAIFLDGIDTKTLSRSTLRSAFGMVLQETWLAGGTIRDNICMSAPEKSEEEMLQCAHAAYCDNFIKRLPNGYDTVLEEDGGSLSQGQKQLLCIARLMLKNPKILILDEATSSIDSRTEIIVQKAFLKLMEGRTSFIVAHRLATIRDADCILVMRDGNVVEQGTHNELLARNGFYTELYESQFKNR